MYRRAFEEPPKRFEAAVIFTCCSRGRAGFGLVKQVNPPLSPRATRALSKQGGRRATLRTWLQLRPQSEPSARINTFQQFGTEAGV